jgi:hypothetical protein
LLKILNLAENDVMDGIYAKIEGGYPSFDLSIIAATEDG